MAGNGDPSEDVPEVQLVDAANVAEKWSGVGRQLDSKGHTIAAFKSKSKGKFPSEIDAAMTAIAQAYCSVGARWTNAAGDVMRQQADVDTPKSTEYKTRTEEVQKAKKATAAGLMIAAMGGSPAYATSAQAALAKARADRQQTLDTALADTRGRVQSLPGHGQAAKDEAAKGRAALVTQLNGGQAVPDNVQQIVPPSSAPTANKSGGPNKPASNTPSSPSKPSGGTPTDEKKGGDEKSAGDPTSAKPQSGLPQSPGQQQGQGQGQQPQQGGAQPGGAAPTGAGAQRAPGALPVSQPTPVRSGDPSGKGGGVRSTPSSPVQTPAQRAGLGGAGKNGTLGSGTAATGAGGAVSPTANKSGIGSGAATGGSNAASTGAGRAPMSGMMGGGHGAGAGGGQARPKAEVKSSDKRLSAEDVAEQALGGIVKDGDDGKPIPPAAPGSNGKAPVPTPPVKP